MSDQQTVQSKTIDNVPAADRAEQYRVALAAISSLCEGETDEIAMMATIACELYHAMPGFDWVGFYRAVGNRTLKIGPYQGGHGCLVISYDRGVCGACARSEKTQIVDDVDAFPGHIACSSATRSEIVLPVHNANGELIAVLDIDSDTPAHFSAEDAAALERMLAETFARG